MKVFISWSGITSKNIAEIFRQWLPSVIQSVKPYYSPDDITKGTRWSSEIAKELDESKLGLICLTRDNLQSPWIMFESGALSKNIDKSKVCPILFGVEPSDIKGPLIQFQAAKFSKEEIKEVVKMINSELGEHALTSEIFENVFEMWWPKLNEKIEEELNKSVKTSKKDSRSERDMLEEILNLTRNISITNEGFSRERIINRNALNPKVLTDLTHTILSVIISLNKGELRDIKEQLNSLTRPLRYLISETEIPRSIRDECRRDLEHIMMLIENFDDVQMKFIPAKHFYIEKENDDESENFI